MTRPLSSMIPPASLLRPVRRVLEVNLTSRTAIPYLIAIPQRFWSSGQEGRRDPESSGANAPFLQINGIGTVESTARPGSVERGRCVCYPHCVPLAETPNSEICPICGEYKPAPLNERNLPSSTCSVNCNRATHQQYNAPAPRLSVSFCSLCQRHRRQGKWQKSSVPFTNPAPHQCEVCRRPWCSVTKVFLRKAPESKEFVQKYLCRQCKINLAPRIRTGKACDRIG